VLWERRWITCGFRVERTLSEVKGYSVSRTVQRESGSMSYDDGKDLRHRDENGHS